MYGILDRKLSLVCVRLVVTAHNSQITKKADQRHRQMLIALIVSAPTRNTIGQEKRFPEDIRAFFWTSANRLGYRYGAKRGDLNARNSTHTSPERSRSMKRIFVLIVLGLLVSSAAVAQKTNIDWDRQANFSQYHTYMWQPSPHPAKGFWDQRIVDAVDKQR